MNKQVSIWGITWNIEPRNAGLYLTTRDYQFTGNRNRINHVLQTKHLGKVVSKHAIWINSEENLTFLLMIQV